MCDRTKSEVLARELCIEFWAGKHHEQTGFDRNGTLQEFVETNWENWLNRAKRIVNILDKHKD